ncbi:MAG: acyl-CoA dehydratase activase-related protein [Defluviitaleaceae bacterium]|nr:acyl-CoA dehydratase activase-related protein [Defluviitaleaceae bacterium]
MKIGIPRALLYYFHHDLWLNFFKNLNIETIVSPETNKAIVEMGVNNSIDEACFSSKIFIGHVGYLQDKCNVVFVPRIENTGIREEYCTRIFGVYDLVRNTFPNVKCLHADVNYLYGKSEPGAFIEIGEALGKDKSESLEAYNNALLTANSIKEAKILQQEKLLNSNGTKILIFAHAYNSYDAAVGKEITDFFIDNNIKVAYADVINEKEAQLLTQKSYGKRIYCRVTAQQIGGIKKYKDNVDGIVIISTFPCGPDAIFSELLIRQIKDKPILNIVIDELDSKAGIQTRMESFIDIINNREVKH